MEGNNTLKGYQQRVFSLNAELNKSTYDHSELQEKHQILKAENLTLMNQLSNQQIQIQQLIAEKESLTHDRGELMKVYQESERQKKVLYDHSIFSRPDLQSQFNKRFLEFSNKVNKVKFDGFTDDIFQLKGVLAEKNLETQKLIRQNRKLAKDLLSLTTQYQSRITALKEENLKLKLSDSSIEIAKVLEELRNGRKPLQEKVQCKSMGENIEVLTALISEYEQKIQNLEEELVAEKRVTRKTSNPTIDVQQYLKLKEENRELKKKLEIVPYLAEFKGEGEIISMFDKLSHIESMKLQIAEKQLKINNLEHETFNKNRMIKGLRQSVEEQKQGRFRETEKYRIIINKYHQYFKYVNPNFLDIELERLGLSETEAKKLNEGERNYTNYQLKFEKLEHQAKLHKLEMKKKQMQLLRHKSMVSNMRICIGKLEKLSNLKQLKELKGKLKDSEGVKLNIIMEQYNKIQEERNEIIIDLHQKQVKIVELLAELNNKSNNCQASIEIIEEKPQPATKLQIKIVNFQKDVFAHSDTAKIEEQLEDIIKKTTDEKDEITRKYENQIFTLRKQLNMAKEKPVDEKEGGSVNNEKRSSHEEIVPPHNPEVLMEMEESSFSNNYEKNEIVNLVSQESIKYFNELLNNHQLCLKSLLEAFEKLKLKYIYLEEKAIDTMEDEEVRESKTEELENLRKSVEEVENQLRESEGSKETLNKLYEEKCTEEKEWKEKHQEETSRYENEINVLKSENQQLRQSIEENKHIVITNRWGQPQQE